MKAQRQAETHREPKLIRERNNYFSTLWSNWKLPFLVLGGYFLLNLICVGASGNFPLNDDWMYGLEVKKLLETGQLRLLGGSPSCAIHVLLGAIVCKIFGFSFVVLRMLCITLSFLCCFLLYAVMRELGGRRRDALCGAALLATNPLYVNLSFGYMTDVPTLTYCLAYALFCLRAIRTSSAVDWVLAGSALVLAIGTRQNSAIFIACNVVVTAMLWFRRRRDAVFSAIFLVGAALACAYYMDHLMSVVNDFPAAYDWYKEEIARLLRLAVQKPFAFFFEETISSVRTAAYLGLFACPLLATILVPSAWLKQGGPRAPEALIIRKETAICMFIALILTMCGVTFLVLFKHQLMPFSPNLFDFPNLGSVTIIASREERNWYIQVGLTVVAAVFACILLFTVICSVYRTALLVVRAFRLRQTTRLSQLRRATACTFVIGLACASFASTVFHTTIANLDRYFLLPLTLVIPCCVLSIRWLRIRISAAFAIVSIGAIGLYSTCAEHDYMSWNRARWDALSELQTQGIAASDIDGGVEFNYMQDPGLSNDLQLGPKTFRCIHRGTGETASLRGWSVHGERFVISMRPINGYRIRSQHTFFKILMPPDLQLFILEASPNQTSNPR